MPQALSNSPETPAPIDPKALIASLSSRPGVYRMLSEKGEILYVGKAKNLKKRVGNYFRASGLDTKTMALVARIANIEVTITSNETEALLLEQTLIKQHRPPYNIELRDDKTYPYIMLTHKDEYPRLAFHRGSKRRDAPSSAPILVLAQCARASVSCRRCLSFVNARTAISATVLGPACNTR